MQNQNLNLQKNIYTVFLNGQNSPQNHEPVPCVLGYNFSTSILKSSLLNLYICDGGFLKFCAWQKKQNNPLPLNCTWIGDADSLNTIDMQNLNAWSEKKVALKKILLNPKKDFNDFSKFLDEILLTQPKNPVLLDIYYGLGGRSDHEKANILEVEFFIKQLPYGGTCFFHPNIIVSSLPVDINYFSSYIFSVFAQSVNIKGAEYSGDFTMLRPSHGLSNQALNDQVKITPLLGSICQIYWDL